MDIVSNDVLVTIERYLGTVQLSLLDQTSKGFRTSVYQVLKERRRQYIRDLDSELPRNRKRPRCLDLEYNILLSNCVYFTMRSFGLSKGFFSSTISEHPQWKSKKGFKLSEFDLRHLLKTKCFESIRNISDLEPIVTAYCRKYTVQKNLEIDM